MKLVPNPEFRFQPPLNESPEHFLLKEVGQFFLKKKLGCSIVGTEVNSMMEPDLDIRDKLSKEFFDRSIADVVGVKFNGRKIKTIYCIEAKASLSDFKAGFCMSGDLNYIIAPVNCIPIKSLPDNVGLIEVDFNKLDWVIMAGWERITGIKVVKRAKRIKRNLFNDDRRDWEIGVLKSIGYALGRNRNIWFYPGYKEYQHE